MQQVQIGSSNLMVHPIGIGVMSWSQSKLWGYGADLGVGDVRGAFQAALEAGINLFDTAEIYGSGRSETILGKLVAESGAEIVVATKYAPLPWRFTAGALRKALDKSLARLGLEQVDLYQIHMPGGLVRQEKLWDALADTVHEGRTRYVGVSNYSAEQMLRAHETLARRGVQLISNQVEYSLVHRSPEVDGLLDACRELNVTLIAYSPLGRGVLNGKYKPGSSANDGRRFYRQFGDDRLARVKPIIETLEAIGAQYGGKSPAQVALNWLARQPQVLPIPGAKHAGHVRSSAEALTWQMSDEEAARLDQAASHFKVAKTFKFRPD